MQQNAVLRRLRHYATTMMLAFLTSALLVFASPVSYAFANTFAAVFMEVGHGKNSGKSRAAARAQAAHGGKVLSVSERKRNGQTVYKVKLLLDSGRIKIVTIKG